MGSFRRIAPTAFCGWVFYFLAGLTSVRGAGFAGSLEHAALSRQIRALGGDSGGFALPPALGRPLAAGLVLGPAAPAASRPVPIHPLAQALQWVTRSPDYVSICRHAYATAWEAVVRAARRETKDWVVVLDVDDTVIQTWSYGEQLVASDSAHTPESWRRWVRRKEATPVPGARVFLDRVRALGPRAHVAFITDDEVELQEAKIEMMRKLGLFADGDIILSKLEPGDTKEARRRCLREGVGGRCGRYGPLVPIVFIGDAIRDLVRVANADEAESIRGKIIRGDAWCPENETCILLPNPVYGAWESDYSR